MTNEPLVAEIQAGAVDRMGELWEQIEKLVKWKANRVMTVLDGRGGVEFDDLYNSGYPALVAAVNSYSPEKGTFATWFMLHLKTAFAEATGYRTQRGKKEPLNNYISLDTPLSDDADSDALMDVIEDPAGLRWRDSLEESMWQEDLKVALDTAMNPLSENLKDVLRLRYWDNMTLEAAGELRGVGKERIRQMENKAIRILRRPENTRHLRSFYEFDFYIGTGLGAFRSTGLSVQERYLVIEEERKEREAVRRKKVYENKMRGAVDAVIERVNEEVETRVANMSPEEKERLMQMYGLT